MKWRTVARKYVAVMLAVAVLGGSGFGPSVVKAREKPGVEVNSGVQYSPGVSYPFSDNVEDPTANNWLADSPWTRTTTDSHSANTSWTDSPGDYYGNNANTSLTLATPLDFTSATNPRLKFWHHYQLEAGFDFGYVEISTNGGANWTALARYSGTQTSPFTALAFGPTAKSATSEPAAWQEAAITGEPWMMEQIDLSAYAGQASVKIRFRLVTDGSTVRDGWYIDDVAIAELPAPVTLATIVGATRTSLTLDWPQYLGPDFSNYAIYRDVKPNVSFRSTRVAAVSGPLPGYVDTGLTSKTTYYYKVYVVSNYEIYSASNEQSGTTLAGLDYPFFDNMEAGTNNWIAEPSNGWTLVTPDSAHSGNKAWTDSPSGDYGNNVDASLALGNDIDINPSSQLTFWHRLNIAAGDQARVEISTNVSSNWTVLTTFTNQQIGPWTRVQSDLGDAAVTARVRFRLVTDGAGTARGWDIDDVGISDLPTAVILSAPVPQIVPNIDKMQLTWTPNNDVYFKSYQIYRDTQAGVDLNDTLVATINNQSTNTTLDSGLLPNTRYYYKVYVLNPGDAVSGSNEVNATTLAPGGVIGYPFIDNMENGVGNWVVQSPWALTQESAHSGNFSWTDSPNISYNNNASASLQISTNLGTAVMPVLDFWQKYSLEQNKDFGYIEASTNGGSAWSRIYFVTGGSSDWVNEQVDLSGLAGQAQVMLRFRVASDASGTADGWYIDDVSINETSIAAINYPFSDNVDSGSKWLSGSWGIVTPGHSPSNAWTDSPQGDYLLDNWMELVLGNTIDLRGTSKPQLTFWHKYNLFQQSSYPVNEQDYGRVYVSNYFGQAGTWQQIAAYTGVQGEWTMVQLDLSAYAGLSTVRIKFVLDDNRDTDGSYGDQYHMADGWYIDDVRIQDAPTDVVLAEPANVTMHSANLSWTQNTESGFARYEIYRAKSAAATRSSTLIATITNSANTTLNDVYTVLQPDRYHYRVYVVDQLGRYSVGSNDVTAIYTVPQVGYPFQDNMEAGTAKWEWSAPWGQSTAFAYSGNTSWADSPLGSYGDGANTALTTSISLSEADSPVLTFWHRYSLEQNLDYGYVEVSTNGGTTWTQLFVVTGNGEWKQERIKLSTYAGAVIGLRFRLASDANGITGDGWYIDDVDINEGLTSASYPFFDNMEGGMGGWFYSSPWGQTTAVSHSANTSWTDSPFGSYANNTNTSLWTTVDLSTAVMPVLDFWQKYSFEQNKDFGYIEASTNGGSAWSRIYFVTGGNDWVNEQVDLSGFVGQAQVMLRFRVVSDANGTADGWYVDDVSINETAVAAINYPFSDSVDSGSKWLSGSWGLVTPGHSPSNAWTDSPDGDYLLDNWMELVLGNVIDLRNTSKPQLTFWHKYNLFQQSSYPVNEQDYGRVYVSNYFGQAGTWQQLAAYTGVQGEWTMVQLDLSAYAGLSSVRIKFVLDDNRDTDGSYGDQYHMADGWYIDDVRIQNAPADVVLAEPTNVTMHSADLSWTQNTESSFARYEIFRSKNTATSRSSTLIATITNQNNTAFTDVYTVLQPDRYHYRVYVVDQLGRYSLGSNDVTAVYTVPQSGYPFQDNMEAGTAKWQWSAPWGQTTAFAHSAGTSWSDSPVGAYADNANTALTTNVNLSEAGSPILTFWHKYAMEQDHDYGYVEVSTNGGATWTQVFVVTGNSEWKWEKVNLTPYAGAVIGLRFRLASDANGIMGDGWYIDDVNINEGLTSAGYPFFDNMEGGMGSWFYSSPWGQTTTLSHSATTSWTDSPFGSYANNANTSLWTTINLSMATMPVLDFWQKYSLERNKDFGYIEVSTNGGSAWSRIYFVTGGSADWVNERVDLSAYTGQAQVMLRFRLVSDATGTADGWYIDDVNINETPVIISYPFFDNMDSGGGKWLSSSWDLVTPGNSTPNAWTDSPEGDYLLDNWMELVLGNTIDLRNTSKPQLTFWHKYNLFQQSSYPINEQDYGRVYVSNYYGQAGTWQQVAAYTGTQGTWTRVKLDLSAYVGLSSVRIKFVLDDNRDTDGSYGDQYHMADGWYIDDVRISEADTNPPAAITNLDVTGVTANSATLAWTAPGDDGNSGTATQYDLRFLAGTPVTEANWNTANQTTGEPAPLPSGFTQTQTVSGLNPDTTYYFAIKAIDEDLNPSPLSNVVSGVTLPDGTVTIRVDAPAYVLTQRDFTARVRLNQVTNLDAASYNVTFNSSVLQLTNVTDGLIGGVQIPVGQWSENSSGIVSIVQNVSGTPGISGSGYLAVLHFHVLGANTTSSQIGLSGGILGDKDAQAIPSRWLADSVLVTTVLPGDANGDEIVNALDLTATERIIVGLSAGTPGADANKDGVVNALDLTLIERIIVGLQ